MICHHSLKSPVLPGSKWPCNLLIKRARAHSFWKSLTLLPSLQNFSIFFDANSPFPFLHQSRKYSNLTILSYLLWKGSPSNRIHLFFYFGFPGCVDICIKAPNVKILYPPYNFIIHHTIFLLLLPIVGGTRSTLWVLSNLPLTWLPTPIISSAQCSSRQYKHTKL